MWLSARWGGAFTPLLVVMVMQMVGWRHAFQIFGCIGLGVGAAVLSLVPQRSVREPEAEFSRTRTVAGKRRQRVRPRGRALGKVCTVAAGLDDLPAIFLFVLRLVLLHHVAAHLSEGRPRAGARLQRYWACCHCFSAVWPTPRGLGAQAGAPDRRRGMVAQSWRTSVSRAPAAFLFFRRVVTIAVPCHSPIAIASFCNDLVMPGGWGAAMDVGGVLPDRSRAR